MPHRTSSGTGSTGARWICIFGNLLCYQRGGLAVILKMAYSVKNDFDHTCYGSCASQSKEKENLCLYRFPCEQWEVNLPAEEVPPELPEPALGINFARDGMQEKDWLSLVAVHSDAWLLLSPSTLVLDSDLIALTATSRSLNSKLRTIESIQTKFSKPQPKDEEPNYDDEGLDDEEGDELGETLCGACGENYESNEFWICCDICEKWFHGKYVKITPARAENMVQYKCPSCRNKRARP
ncbi:PHD finger protein ALFIN-LIKE 4-like isoform X2 [Salvia divinorum]|uniref:PHD finger protein ALFIN-LIKE n=1 Tax=Salvia divinorum TaxID=28513 RepID=A0ABD1H5L4_SALDI